MTAEDIGGISSAELTMAEIVWAGEISPRPATSDASVAVDVGAAFRSTHSFGS